MCLGFPGQVIALTSSNDQLATADVAGVRRTINIGLLDVGSLSAGDWVLIHVGFAMSKIDEAEAARALEGLKLMGAGFDEEVALLRDSR